MVKRLRYFYRWNERKYRLLEKPYGFGEMVFGILRKRKGTKYFFFMLYRLHKNLYFTFNIKQIILIVNSVNLFTV